MNRKWLTILCFIFTILLLAPTLSWCRSEEPSFSSSLGDPVLPAENEEQYDLIFVCPILDSPYWEACMDGMQRADGELGTCTKTMGPQTADNFAVEIVPYLEKAIEEHPDGIFTYAGIEALTPYIEKAEQEGIPVITVDSDALTDTRTAYVGTNLYSLGHTAGETLATMTDGQARIGYICSYTDASNEREVLEALKDAIHDFDMEIVASEEGHNDIQYAADVTRQMLEEHPDITALFCTGGMNVTGAGKYVEEAGLNDITVIGLEDTEENLKLVRTGAIDTLLVQAPEDMGYLSVYVMKEYLDKGILPNSVYYTNAILVTKENADTYHTESFSPDLTLKTVRIGYYDGNTAFQNGFSEEARKSGYAYEYYQAIGVLAGWTYEYVYGSRSEIMDALRNGEVDIVAGVYHSDNHQDGFFYSSEDMGLGDPKRYFAVNESREDLLNELNGAISKLMEETPNFLPTLYSKYYRQYVGTQILTNAERSFLADLGQMKFGYMRYNLPLSDQDADGNPTGLVKDLIEYIVNYTHTPIQPIAYDNSDELDDALRCGEIDVSFPEYLDVWMSEQNGFRQTDVIVSDRVMMVYAGNYTDDMMSRVAINQTGIGQAYYMSQYYPNSALTFYSNREEVFDALKRGEERCTVGSSSVLQRFLLDHPEYSDPHIAYLSATVELGMTVSDENSYLISILNKAMSNMGSAAISSSVLSYTSTEEKTTFTAFVRENSIPFILTLSLFLTAMGVLFFLYIRQSRLFQKKQVEANHALTAALNDAEAASIAKTRFLSSMSHDIRTPMNAIIGMTSVAAKYPDDKEHMLDCLKKINLSGQHLLTLINDVLDISKIESGKLALNPVEFSLEDSIKNLNIIFVPAANDKNLLLEIHGEELAHPFVYADEVRVNQIFVNLLSNAIKYTPEGGRVTVTVKETPLPEHDHMQLTYIVEDTGIGMSEAFMAGMYEMFSRAQDTRTSKIQGTGLGLTIVKQMVDLMHGSITCDSTENVGTRFTVTLELPIVEKSRHQNDAQVSTEFLSGRHLLIAEDNDLNWEVISELLDVYGIGCERAENGQICVEKLLSAKEGTYDLVLMDIQMPVLNGKDATRQIRNAGCQIPIIAMTADAFAEDIAECLSVGMNGHVAKPIDMEKLLYEMQKTLIFVQNYPSKSE